MKEFCFSLLFLHLSPPAGSLPCNPSLALQPCCSVAPSQMVDPMDQRIACYSFFPDQSALPCSVGDKGEAMCRHRADQPEKEHEE